MKSYLMFVTIYMIGAVCGVFIWNAIPQMKDTPEHACPIPTIRYIQSVLIEHGYYDGPQDGILGNGTISGLREMSADADREDNNKTAIELSGGVYNETD